jgi:hypothetical protein
MKRLSKIRLLDWLRRADYYIITLLFSILLSPIIGVLTLPLFDTPARVIYLSTLFLILVMVLFLVFNKRAVTRYEALQAEIIRRIGLSVEFLTAEGQFDKDVYKRAAAAIHAAKDEILILDYYPRPYKITEPQGEDRGGWYAALEAAIERSVKYKRVIQIPEEPPSESISKGKLKDPTFIAHCEKLLHVRKSIRYPHVTLKRSRAFLPEDTLVIIDERYLFWSVTIDSPAPEDRLQGVLLFDDPHGELVKKHLVKLFRRIDEEAILVTSISS